MESNHSNTKQSKDRKENKNLDSSAVIQLSVRKISNSKGTDRTRYDEKFHQLNITYSRMENKAKDHLKLQMRQSLVLSRVRIEEIFQSPKV